MRAHFGIYIHIYRIYIQTHTLYQTTKKSKSNFAYFPQLCKFGLKLCKIYFTNFRPRPFWKEKDPDSRCSGSRGLWVYELDLSKKFFFNLHNTGL